MSKALVVNKGNVVPKDSGILYQADTFLSDEDKDVTSK